MLHFALVGTWRGCFSPTPPRPRKQIPQTFKCMHLTSLAADCALSLATPSEGSSRHQGRAHILYVVYEIDSAAFNDLKFCIHGQSELRVFVEVGGTAPVFVEVLSQFPSGTLKPIDGHWEAGLSSSCGASNCLKQCKDSVGVLS